MDVEPREGDFLETNEGLIFDVKGLNHPHDRVIAFLRYYPKMDGTRLRDGIHYEKIYSLSQRYAFLEKNFPHYLFYDKFSDETLQGVPRENIIKIYRPDEFLKNIILKKIILEGDSSSSLLIKCLDMVKMIHLQSGVSFDKMGISGSLLVNLETEKSDIDLMIYGSWNARKVYKSLSKIHNNPPELIHPYSEEEIVNLYKFRGKESNLSFQEFSRLERRKKLQGIFKGTEYYIRCIKDRNELKSKYQENEYKSMGRGTLRGVVTNDMEAIFTPCKYLIDITNINGIKSSKKIREIVSFRGRFCELARKGELIEACGKVELVKLKDIEYYRLLIGSHPEDYFRVLNFIG